LAMVAVQLASAFVIMLILPVSKQGDGGGVIKENRREKNVQLEDGQEVKGVEDESSSGKRQFWRFDAVRYAKSERFLPPTPAGKLKEDPSVPPVCAQASATLVEEDIFAVGLEDCLFLQVFAPDACWSLSPACPVVAWFKSGESLSPSSGSVRSFGPHVWMENDLILVVVNSRQGILGSLNGDDQEAPLRLLDQKLALAWIQREITAFGGNPRRVIAAGQGLGGHDALAHVLLARSAEEGLIHGVISQSG